MAGVTARLLRKNLFYTPVMSRDLLERRVDPFLPSRPAYDQGMTADLRMAAVVDEAGKKEADKRR